jgi:hypothetical protein
MFHYGVANPILTGTEEAYVARRGRGWLGSFKEEICESRTAMVLGPDHGETPHGLRYFDPLKSWEVYCTCFMVGDPITGAFILSFFTPTVGNGCRLGDYSIFFIMTIAAATFEALAWWQLPKDTPNSLRTSSEPQSAFRLALSLLRNTLRIRPSQTCRSDNPPRDGACQHSVVMLHYLRPNVRVVQ